MKIPSTRDCCDEKKGDFIQVNKGIKICKYCLQLYHLYKKGGGADVYYDYEKMPDEDKNKYIELNMKRSAQDEL